MTKYILGALAFSALSIASFFVTLTMFKASDGPVVTGSIAQKPSLQILPVGDWVNRLNACGSEDEATRKSRCSSIASQLIRNIARAKEYELARNSAGRFSLFLVENKLIYLKENCNAADVAVDNFTINYFPKKLSAVSERRRKRGLTFISEASSFKKSGYLVDGSCLLSANLKVAGRDLKQIQTGQHQGAKGWAWRVYWKLP